MQNPISLFKNLIYVHITSSSHCSVIAHVIILAIRQDFPNDAPDSFSNIKVIDFTGLKNLQNFHSRKVIFIFI